jgi:hypothetical protein
MSINQSITCLQYVYVLPTMTCALFEIHLFTRCDRCQYFQEATVILIKSAHVGFGDCMLENAHEALNISKFSVVD